MAISVEEILEELRDVKKDELSEREFYASVIKVVNKLDNIETEQDFKKLSETLKKVGCLDSKMWEKERETTGEKLENVGLETASESGNLVVPKTVISYIMDNMDSANYAIEYMIKTNTIIPKWLEKNELILSEEKKVEDAANALKTIKKDELSEREFYASEHILKQNYENSTPTKQSNKSTITSTDIALTTKDNIGTRIMTKVKKWVEKIKNNVKSTDDKHKEDRTN